MSVLKANVCEYKNRIVQRSLTRFDRELAQVDAWSSDRLAQLNWDRCKSLVAYCAAKVPFYQRRFAEAGFEPGDLRTREDFGKLRILQKSDIREYERDLVSRDFAGIDLPESTTGGSTGKPLRTFTDPRVSLAAISWRMLRWWGVEPWMNAGYVYRAVPTGRRKLITSIALFPTRRAYLSALDMSRENMRQFCNAMVRVRAKYVVGYVGALDALAIFMEEQDIRIPSLRALWTTAAPLPELKRIQLTRAFGCPVYTQYGSCEFYFLAAECERQSGLHIASDVRHVEIVDSGVKDNQEGEGYGDVVATDLTNYAFPLLRYRVGDRGRLLDRSCGCGRPYPLMDYVRGRISDNIILDDGTFVPGEFWTTIFDDYVDRVRAFQVHQHANRTIVVRFEPTRPSSADMVAAVRTTLERKIKGRAAIRFSEEAVQAHEGGKTRYVICDVPREL